MKQTMHDRFLASEKKRKTASDALLRATQERVKADQLLREATAKLFEAEKTLESAMLTREGWDKVSDWVLALHDRWQHSSGFEIIKSAYFGGWGLRRLRVRGEERPYTTIDDGRYVVLCNSSLVYYDSLEAVLEAWRLKVIDLGRYPEPLPKGLFDRLRED